MSFLLLLALTATKLINRVRIEPAARFVFSLCRVGKCGASGEASSFFPISILSKTYHWVFS